ncbi:MAG: hypothetical protein AAGD10_16835 [Myxococcota bacterium]
MSEDALVRVQQIERIQRLKAATGVTSTVLVGQVLFGAFVFGHGRGPVPIRGIEVLAGMAAALLLSLLFAPWWARRRTREGASWVGHLQEGRHARRLLVFDDCFIIEGEVILYEEVLRHEADGERLSLRYRDPKHEGPVLREFEGPPEATRRLARRLEGMAAARDLPSLADEAGLT